MAGHPDAAIRLTTYAELDTFVRAYASGAFNLLVLLGSPGLQKSRAAREVLRRLLDKRGTPLPWASTRGSGSGGMSR